MKNAAKLFWVIMSSRQWPTNKAYTI